MCKDCLLASGTSFPIQLWTPWKHFVCATIVSQGDKLSIIMAGLQYLSEQLILSAAYIMDPHTNGHISKATFQKHFLKENFSIRIFLLIIYKKNQPDLSLVISAYNVVVIHWYNYCGTNIVQSNNRYT